MAEPIRLQKYFTDCGVLSRRAAEEEIRQGNVTVNGCVALLGDKIDPDVDVVEFGGKRILPRKDRSHCYLLLNKPRGIVTSAKDEKGRRTVVDLVSSVGRRVYPVGRLDMDSDGLLLLTDDGELANRLTHPRHEIPKIYRVTTASPVTDEQKQALSAPMELDGYRLLPIGVKPLSDTLLELTLYEGRNRQIRRMCEQVGIRITRLSRIAIGDIRMGDLPPGRWRSLTEEEIAYLQGENKHLHSKEKE
jgi:23S rRNA pseudouridine2605 synthase